MSNAERVEREIGCEELAEDGSCIHSDHMAAIEAARYRDEEQQ